MLLPPQIESERFGEGARGRSSQTWEWIPLRDQIDLTSFVVAGRGDRTCAGMPELRYGAEQSPTD
jgi:hypothetical protein